MSSTQLHHRARRLPTTLTPRPLRLSIAALLAVFVGLLAAGPVAATEFVVVPAADFRTNNDVVTYSDGMKFDYENGYITRNYFGGGCMHAPAGVPDGATITSMTGYLRDSTDGDFSVSLNRRASTGSGPAEEMASVTTTGSSSIVSAYPDLSIASPTVDAASFTYFVEACLFGANVEDLFAVYAVKIGYTPSIGDISQVVVSAASFRDQSDFAYAYGYDSTDGYLWSGDADNPGCVVAPVFLENGSEITDLSADLYDSSTTSNFMLQLRRQSFVSTASSELIAEIQTTGDSTSIARLSAPTITNGEVNNLQYAYFLTTANGCLQAGDREHRIYAARIFAQQPIFADGFESGDVLAWSSSVRLTGSPVIAKLQRAATDHLNMLSGAAFYINETNVNNSFTFNSTGGYFSSGSDYRPCAVAPVRLPDGATLWYMKAVLYDNTNTTDLILNLRRKSYTNTTASTIISTVDTTGTLGLFQHSGGISEPAIDTDLYTYYLETCPNDAGDLLRIYGVLFAYTTP